MSTRGALLRVVFHSLTAWILLFRCSVFSLVPVPHNNPINDTIELEIHNRTDCPRGYYAVKYTPCRRCTPCRSKEIEVSKCSRTQDTVCGCDVGLVYSEESRGCISPGGVSSSPSSSPPSNGMTTKAPKAQSSHVQDGEDVKAQHATKPDWTDFYILTVSSTAVLFFTLSLVLLFLMAVMKARSWYLYRRLPGSGCTLCFRGWMSRILRRVLPQQEDRSTDPIEVIAGVPELSITKDTPDGTHQLKSSEVVEYLDGMDAVICCADLHFTFPQKKTYITSCITSESEVAETRSKWCPSFTSQACHKAVNVVLRHHRCCRHRNMLTLTSSQDCDLGYFEAATMEVQEQSSSDSRGERSSEDENDDINHSQVSPCQHQETAGIRACDVLILYKEIAAPFKESRDLVFNGSLKLYLRRSSAHQGRVKEKVKLKYRGDRRDDDEETVKDSEESEALLKSGISDVRYLYSLSPSSEGRGERIPGTDECIPGADEAVSESSVEVVVELHDDRKTVAVTSV